MKKLNHYQKDIAFILLLIGLQIIFSYFYPFKNPEVATPIEVSRSFLLIRFTFVNLNQTVAYFPTLTIIFALLLIMLLIQKKRRFALIYGFAVVLVTKAYYLTELYALNGVYNNMETQGILSKKIIIDNQIYAEDVSLYIMAILLVIKIAIYVHDIYMFKRNSKPTA